MTIADIVNSNGNIKYESRLPPNVLQTAGPYDVSSLLMTKKAFCSMCFLLNIFSEKLVKDYNVNSINISLIFSML